MDNGRQGLGLGAHGTHSCWDVRVHLSKFQAQRDRTKWTGDFKGRSYQRTKVRKEGCLVDLWHFSCGKPESSKTRTRNASDSLFFFTRSCHACRSTGTAAVTVPQPANRTKVTATLRQRRLVGQGKKKGANSLTHASSVMSSPPRPATRTLYVSNTAVPVGPSLTTSAKVAIVILWSAYIFCPEGFLPVLKALCSCMYIFCRSNRNRQGLVVGSQGVHVW